MAGLRDRPPNLQKMKYCIIIILLSGCTAPLSLRGDKSEIGTPRVMQGPMVGYVTHESISVWVRVSGPYEISIRYRESESDIYMLTRAVKAASDGDFAAVILIEGLNHSTTYEYQVLIDGDPTKYLKNKRPFRVNTAPGHEEMSRFTVAFGSCARVQEDRIQNIWYQINQEQPDLFFWLGDNIYGDSLYPQFLAEEYRRQRDVASYQSLMRSVPQLATWDDHDFGLNDHDRTNPVKADALNVFKQYWANPSYGQPENPGVYFHYAYGAVDFFFLDCRYHRSSYDLPESEKTLLGKNQLNWLKEGLKSSIAPFKILITGSGWTSLKGTDEGDSWAPFKRERNELFTWITEEEIGGVVLLSGDTHRGELNAIPWSERGGYDLYEFVSSPLAQDTSNRNQPPIWEVYLDEVYTGGVNYGLLAFDLTKEDPELTFTLRDQFGNRVLNTVWLKASELRNGVRSWPSKISSDMINLRQSWADEKRLPNE